MFMNETKLLDANGKEYSGEYATVKEFVAKIEKHWALCTATAAAGITLLTFLFNVYFCGKAEYWGIAPKWVETEGKYAIYNIAKYVVIFLIYALLNCIPYGIAVRNKEKKAQAIIKMILSIIILSAALFIVACFSTGTVIMEFFSESTASQIISILMAFFSMVFFGLIFGIIFGLGQLFHWFEKPTKNSKFDAFVKSHRLLAASIILPVLVVLEVLLIVFLGKTVAESQKEYDIVEEYVVLGEKNDKYICSPIISKENNELIIDIGKHIVISSQDITTETHCFDKVYVKK